MGTVQYPGATKTLVSTDGDSRFTLHVEPGDFKGAEMIGMLGENGCSHANLPGLRNRRPTYAHDVHVGQVRQDHLHGPAGGHL